MSFYKPKEAFEECDIYKWSKCGEIQEGGDVNTAVKEKEKQGVGGSPNKSFRISQQILSTQNIAP